MYLPATQSHCLIPVIIYFWMGLPFPISWYVSCPIIRSTFVPKRIPAKKAANLALSSQAPPPIRSFCKKAFVPIGIFFTNTQRFPGIVSKKRKTNTAQLTSLPIPRNSALITTSDKGGSILTNTPTGQPPDPPKIMSIYVTTA